MASVEELESQAKAAMQAGNREQAVQLAKQAYEMRQSSQGTTVGDYASDIARGGVRGTIEGVEGLVGFPRTAAELAGGATKWAMEKLGASPEDIAAGEKALKEGLFMLPSTDQVRDVRQQAIGDIAPPKTRAGEIAQTVGRNVPNALFPGNRVANVLAPAAGEEAGAQAARTFAPTWEDEARLGGSLMGALSATPKYGAVERSKEVVDPLTRRGQAVEKYNALRQSGVKVAERGTAKILGALDRAAQRANLNPKMEAHQNMAQRLADIKNIGTSPNTAPARIVKRGNVFTTTPQGPNLAKKVELDDLVAIRDRISEGYIQGQVDNNRLVGEMKRAFDDAVENLQPSDFAAPGGRVGRQAFEDWTKARKLWRQYKTSERFAQIHENARDAAQANLTAPESLAAYMASVKQQLRSMAKDDFKKYRYLSKEEKKWVKDVIQSVPDDFDDAQEVFKVEQKLRNFGKMAGGKGKGAFVTGGGTAATVGSMSGDPMAGLAAGTALVGAGNKAQRAAAEMALDKFNRLRQGAAGGPELTYQSRWPDVVGKTLPSTYDRNQR